MAVAFGVWFCWVCGNDDLRESGDVGCVKKGKCWIW
jgi:hypothetical protein